MYAIVEGAGIIIDSREDRDNYNNYSDKDSNNNNIIDSNNKDKNI